MRDTQNYTFEVSISTEGFDHKPNKNTEIPSLRYYKTTTDIGGFVESILSGHCYTTVYPFDSFCMKQKTDSNFSHSSFISLDFDKRNVDMTTFVDNLEFKPTIAYTTSQNGLEGCGYRYRLIYCFEDRIESNEEYEKCVCSVLEANHIAIADVDDKSFKASQFFIGNGTDNAEVSTNNIIYSIKDFNQYSLLYKEFLDTKKNKSSKNTYNSKKDNKNHIQQPPYNMNLIVHFENKQFEEDFWNLRMEEIIGKYIGAYPPQDNTPLPTVDDDTPYILFPKDYTEIRRYWTKRNEGRAIKIKDGQGRRKKLFFNGVIRRLINPNITFDHLLFNLLFELFYYISNYKAENIIGKKEIFNIAKDVMKADLSKYEGLRGTKRKYIANPNYCVKHNLSKQKVSAIAAKELCMGNNKRNKIGKLYDYSLTDKQNSEMMKEYGLDVSEKSIQRWRKDKGIAKYKKRK